MLERKDVITKEILETFTFVLAYPLYLCLKMMKDETNL